MLYTNRFIGLVNVGPYAYGFGSSVNVMPNTDGFEVQFLTCQNDRSVPQLVIRLY